MAKTKAQDGRDEVHDEGRDEDKTRPKRPKTRRPRRAETKPKRAETRPKEGEDEAEEGTGYVDVAQAWLNHAAVGGRGAPHVEAQERRSYKQWSAFSKD